jgi:hypothetical protein
MSPKKKSKTFESGNEQAMLCAGNTSLKNSEMQEENLVKEHRI